MNDRSTFSLLVNPFTLLAGSKSLLLGLIFFAITTITGSYAGLVFDGVINIHLLQTNLGQAFIIHGLSLISLVLFMYLAGVIFSGSSIRFIDVAGTMTLSRAPFLLSALFILVPGVYSCLIEFAGGLMQMSFTELSIGSIVVGILSFIVFFVSIVWFIILAYNAFTVSCNIKGRKNIIVFIAALIISFLVSFVATTVIFSSVYMNAVSTNVTVVDPSDTAEYETVNRIAVEAAESIRGKNYQKTVSYFDSQMQKALPVEKLKETIEQIEEQFGTIRNIGTEVSNMKVQGNRLVLVPVQFEKQTINFRFTFDDNDRIIGFYL